jgi:hypothetical protein
LYLIYQFRNAMNTTKIAIAILLAGITALVEIAMVPTLTNEAYAHVCLLPNSGNTAFPGQTPLAGNCPAGAQPLQNQNQETARGLIGQQQNNNQNNFYCAETLGSDFPGSCPF